MATLADLIGAAVTYSQELVKLRDLQDRKRAIQQDLISANSDIDAQLIVVQTAQSSLKAMLA